MKGGQVRRLEAEGARGENQWGPSRRGRCGGGGVEGGDAEGAAATPTPFP
jgi:hypothetical protein